MKCLMFSNKPCLTNKQETPNPILTQLKVYFSTINELNLSMRFGADE